MIEIHALGRAAGDADELKGRIVGFMRSASTEIIPQEEKRLEELGSVLPSGTVVYIAHTPNTSLEQVVRAALAVQRAGFLATPHIAARRIPNERILKAALAELRRGGVDRILLIAGDAPRPLGEFASTMDVLERGILSDSGIVRVGVAGHPRGHHAVDSDLLWDALRSKQEFAARSGLRMHVVTQFGLDVGALGQWERELVRRGVRLPVHVGIAGPSSVARLIRFAIRCGVNASAHALIRGVGGSVLATTADQHLITLAAMPVPPQFVAPHFFAFGGAVETARWIRSIAAGAFDIDPDAGVFRLHA